MNFKIGTGLFLLLPCSIVFANEVPTAVMMGGCLACEQPPSLDYSAQHGASSDEKISLFLTTTVNHSANTEVLPFAIDGRGRLYAKARDLRHIRIQVAASIGDDTWILLSSIANLHYQYHEANQSVSIQLPLKQMSGYAIDLRGNEVTEDALLTRKHLNAALLNYSIYTTNTDGDNVVSGTGEAIINTPIGNLASSFVYNSKPEQFNMKHKLVRLDSYWQYIDPIKIRSYTAGDFVSNSPDWGSSVRMAGFQWASAYRQRSDIITAALPQFSGSAALPSTLDVYIDQQKIYSGDIPSGPFDIKSLPFISGNEVTLVTKDATGQQIVSTQNYYYTPQLLRPGTKEFSVDIGVPRYYFGTESSRYDTALFGSGVIKYGVMPGLTVTSNIAVTSDGLINIGGGIAASLLQRGVLTVAAAGSQYKDVRGGFGLVALEGRLSKYVQFNASHQKTFAGYHDLARVSEARFRQSHLPNQHGNNIIDGQRYSTLASSITRVGMSFYPRSGYGASVNYSRLKTEPNRTYQPLSLNLSGTPTKNLNIYFSVFKDLSDSKQYGGYLSLRYALDTKINTTTSFTKNQQNNTIRQEISSQGNQRIGDVSWGAFAERDNNHHNAAAVYASYLSRPAYLTAQYSRFGKQSQIMASARGSLVAAAGTVFAAHEIGDAYAIVKNAGPGSHILNGGVDLGRTDGQGRYLIANLPAYSKRSIYVDPTHLPLNWDVEATEQQVVSGYRQGTVIDFGAQEITSASANIVNGQHRIIAAGYPVKLNGQDSGVVGYNGEVYLKNPLKNNTIEVDMFEQGVCRASFLFDRGLGARQNIGSLLCQ